MIKWLLTRNKRFPNERHATARHGLITNEMQQKLLTTNLIAPETSYIEASLTKLDFKFPIVLLLWEWKDTLSLLYASHTPPRIDVRKTRKRKRNTAWDLAFPEEKGDAWTAESSRDSKARRIFQFCFAINRCSSSGLIKDNCSCAWHPVDIFYAFCFLKCCKTTEEAADEAIGRNASSMANYGHPENQEAPESDNMQKLFSNFHYECVCVLNTTNRVDGSNLSRLAASSALSALTTKWAEGKIFGAGKTAFRIRWRKLHWDEIFDPDKYWIKAER